MWCDPTADSDSLDGREWRKIFGFLATSLHIALRIYSCSFLYF
ncbi:hypothetical protein CORMATOL_02704 [Corynebacterium matruchotii ATCC 33806]|uniref:Uncharacterized protein n=1 Tax=Corynebacterium matruchotii ATCC 33806 TaxID=566549 RepID=C0E6R6_9CORY|nr:hypothetical protein CORMATOL_02704 [Corynebacterium matruchotii ATCC 33806]